MYRTSQEGKKRGGTPTRVQKQGRKAEDLLHLLKWLPHLIIEIRAKVRSLTVKQRA